MSPAEKIINEKLIPALFDDIAALEEFRKLLALPWKLGGMSMIDPTENANDEYKNSKEPTSQLTNSIKQQEHRYTVSDENIKNCLYLKRNTWKKHFNIFTSLPEQISSKNKKLNDATQEEGISSWLTALPIKQLRLSLSKAELWNADYWQYGLPRKRFPIHCGFQALTQSSMRYRAKKNLLL